ncbi:YicC/YloC family endoribonuclease [Eubacteriales bacterium KG127]
MNLEGKNMIKSMTGFGRGEYKNEKYSVVVELKAVNHKYTDFNFRIPRTFAFAEEDMKKEIKRILNRGKVEVQLSLENLKEETVNVTVNTKLASEYMKKLSSLSNACGLEEKPKLEMLAKLPEVIVVTPEKENRDEILEAILAATSDATKNLDKMRHIEGIALAEDILERQSALQSILEKMRPLAAYIPENYKIRLRDRIGQILDKDTNIPEDKIAMEVAIFADKASIDEELTRLASHLKQLKTLVSKESGSKGKKLDFLVQEMNREANTIGAKANDLQLTKLVLEGKAEIEKIREQIQNIE